MTDAYPTDHDHETLKLMRAVEKRFDVTIGFDICCTSSNCQAFIEHLVKVNENCEPDPNGEHYVGKRSLFGYFRDKGVDPLEQDWSTIEQPTAWLRVPEAEQRAWWKKLCRFRNSALRLFVLVPFNDYWGDCVRNAPSLCAKYSISIQGKPFLLLDWGATPVTQNWDWENQ